MVRCRNPNRVFASTDMKVCETNPIQHFLAGSYDKSAWEGEITPKPHRPRTNIKTNSPIRRRGPKHSLPKFRTRDYKILPTNSDAGSTLTQELNDGFDGHINQTVGKHMSGKRRRKSPLLLGLSSLATSGGQQVAYYGATPKAEAESDIMSEISDSERPSEFSEPGPALPVSRAGHLFHEILPSIECSVKQEVIPAPHLIVSPDISGRHPRGYSDDELPLSRRLTNKRRNEPQTARILARKQAGEETELLHSSRHVQPSQRSSPESFASSTHPYWVDQTWNLGSLRPAPQADWMTGSAKRSSAGQKIENPDKSDPANVTVRVASRDNDRGASVGRTNIDEDTQDYPPSLQYLQRQRNHQGRQPVSVMELGCLQALRPKSGFVAE